MGTKERLHGCLAVDLVLVIMAAACLPLRAQVPQIINYQGRVAVNGVNFTGNGLFKFSLVNSNGTATFWSNDGSGVGGRQPTAPVAVTVERGSYAVCLGDTSLRNMTPISPRVFENSDVRLRIWFNDGTNDFQLLTPDQRITAVGYAMVAANVPDGSITAEKLAPGAALANLAGASGVSGSVSLSTDPNSTVLLEAGYMNIGPLPLTGERWEDRARSPSPRGFATAVWTGREMLVWGGGNFDFYNDGGRYSPANNSWRSISTSDAPSPRWFHQAVWTGREMLIWGGRMNFFSQDHSEDGGRYDPATDTWTPISTTNAPTPRSQFTAIWTGSELLVWGGMGDFEELPSTGARYNPSTDTWTAMTTNGAPSGRVDYGAVWTGTEMIIWGGWDLGSDSSLGDGARYNPATDEWRPISSEGAPPSTHWPSAVWTGREMVIWSGRHQPDNVSLTSGGRYDPRSDSWRPISQRNVPQGRMYQSTVWTGSEMIIWGGSPGGGFNEMNSGGRYNPTTDSWITLTTQNAPAPRIGQAAVWSGQGLIIFAGYQNHPNFEVYNSNSIYIPAKPIYVYQKP